MLSLEQREGDALFEVTTHDSLRKGRLRSQPTIPCVRIVPYRRPERKGIVLRSTQWYHLSFSKIFSKGVKRHYRSSLN